MLDLKALTVITADEQTAGRGRGGRVWVSTGTDDVKMTFAFGLPASHVASAYLLSPLLSVAALRALRRSAPGDSRMNAVGIKWPNDIVMGGARKLGGILCEMESAVGGNFFVALGIGINVNSTPEGLDVPRAQWPLTTLRTEVSGRGGYPLDIVAITNHLIDEFAAMVPLFTEQGWAPFREEYALASVLLGHRIRFAVDAPGAAEKRTVTGIAESFADDGSLLVRDDKGDLLSFLAGEVAGIMLDKIGMIEGDAAF